MRSIIAAALILVLFMSGFADHAEAHTGWYTVNAGNGLNLRSGPGGEYRRLLTMPHGAVVKAYGHRGNWMKVGYQGTIGWAWLAYLVQGAASSTSEAPTGGGYCMTNAFGEYACASPNTADAIRYWFGYYGVGSWWGFAVAACESAFDPYAYNAWSGVSGLFQFQPSTFYAYGGRDLWNVWDQSRVAAYMFSHGLGFHWDCAWRVGW